MSDQISAVDERLPLPRLSALGLQHVLVMYAGAVAVPLIVGRALKLPPEQVAMLISADLFAGGLVTLLQAWGAPGVGIRLPVMMGVTFAAVGPMIAIGTNPELGLLAIYGSVMVSGLFGVLIAPFVSRLLPLFPPVVTGTIITVIGISLMRVGVNWAAGGIGNPNFGSPLYLGMALFVLVVILAVTKWGKGFVANIAVLIGIVVGCAVAALLGQMHFAKVAAAPWFGIITPFQFGMPVFDIGAIVTMCLVMIVVMIESTGMFLALGEMTGTKVDPARLTKGLRADGLGTFIGGVFNTFPYTSFSQNVGLVGVTGVRSRWVAVAGGFIMLALGLMPKLSALVESVPQFVLGGAGLCMFGMVAATGIRILADVDFKVQRNNLLIVAISIGFGMIPLVAPKFFEHMPKAISPLLESGILLASIVAVILNAFFNGLKGEAEALAEATAAGEAAEHV
ncbi:nucleobase:cation symporter-2 family protein [Pinisolibacter sp.]|uniref:nucleobase:cation symporter-2 family protein n=1 Tax=Pinisolibacter sp. TaxID=2172024 RepID=UPI002FDD7127